MKLNFYLFCVKFLKIKNMARTCQVGRNFIFFTMSVHSHSIIMNYWRSPNAEQIFIFFSYSLDIDRCRCRRRHHCSRQIV